MISRYSEYMALDMHTKRKFDQRTPCFDSRCSIVDDKAVFAPRPGPVPDPVYAWDLRRNHVQKLAALLTCGCTTLTLLRTSWWHLRSPGRNNPQKCSKPSGQLRQDSCSREKRFLCCCRLIVHVPRNGPTAGALTLAAPMDTSL